MKQIVSLLSCALFLSTSPMGNTLPALEVAPYYSIRSQGVDAARELSGWSQIVNRFDAPSSYGTLALTAEYTQSFRPQSIAKTLFGSALICGDDCNDSVVNVTGSRAPFRGPLDLLADDFYLPTDYVGKLFFKPRIQNVIIDLNFYLGFSIADSSRCEGWNAWTQGWFFRIDMPLNWSRWDLGFCEQVITTGTNNYDPGYFNGYNIAPTDLSPTGSGVQNYLLNHSFSAYARGEAPHNVFSMGPDSDPVITRGLDAAKFDWSAHSVTRLADLQMILGWNFINDNPNYHLGIGAIVRAPTGNKPNGCLLFEPISGNGGHWELGAHITSHGTLWRCDQEDASFGFYLDANITHLFNTKQTRTFDLINKPLSRYMLASTFTPEVEGLAGGTPREVPAYQFANAFTPVANFTTHEVQVSVGVQGDLAAQFSYVNGGWNWDVGYNFWGRSCEKFKCKNPCNIICPEICLSACSTSCDACPIEFTENTFGLKGDSYVYGFDNVLDIAVPLSATENEATIYAGTNFSQTGASSISVPMGQTNAEIDNAQLAYHGTDETDAALDVSFASASQTHTSIDPILIKETDFNIQGTRAITNKIYTHLSYNWGACAYGTPYIGIGAFGEFGNRNRCCRKPECVSTTFCNPPGVCDDNCVETALSQWGVWIKGGVSFN